MLIIHHRLDTNSKDQVIHLANQLGCNNVLDYTDIYQKIFGNEIRSNATDELLSISPIQIISRQVDQYQYYITKLMPEILDRIGDVKEVFFRSIPADVDRFFLNCFCGSIDFYCVEDGIGEYVPPSWSIYTLNRHELFVQIRERIRAYCKFMVSVGVTKELTLSHSIYVRPSIKARGAFTNIERHKRTLVKDEFVENINNLSKPDRLSERKILIIGSLITDPRFKFSLSDEIELYNCYIEVIKRKYKIGNSDIWYKHHPRLSKSSWEKKRKLLNCKIYEYSHYPLAEMELCDKNIQAVYSVGSTALLYASVIFGKAAYLIDLSNNRNVHPSHYKKYKCVAEKFNISIV